MLSNKLFLVIFTISALLILIWLTSSPDTKSQTPIITTHDDYLMAGYTGYQYNIQGKLKAQLKAKTATLTAMDNTGQFTQPELKVFIQNVSDNKNNEHHPKPPTLLHLSANLLSNTQRTNELLLSGNIQGEVIDNETGTPSFTLNTQQLSYDQTKQHLSTQDTIHIVEQQGQLSGEGLLADLKQSSFKLHNKVVAQINTQKTQTSEQPHPPTTMPLQEKCVLKAGSVHAQKSKGITLYQGNVSYQCKTWSIQAEQLTDKILSSGERHLAFIGKPTSITQHLLNKTQVTKAESIDYFPAQRQLTAKGNIHIHLKENSHTESWITAKTIHYHYLDNHGEHYEFKATGTPIAFEHQQNKTSKTRFKAQANQLLYNSQKNNVTLSNNIQISQAGDHLRAGKDAQLFYNLTTGDWKMPKVAGQQAEIVKEQPL